MEKMLPLHTLTIRESDKASSVEFRPVVLEEISYRTNDLTTDARAGVQKNNVALSHLTIWKESVWFNSAQWFRRR